MKVRLMPIRQIIFVALAAAVTMLSVGPESSFAADVKMVLATGVDPGFTHFYVAVNAGILKKNGIDAELQTGPSGGAMVPLVVSNQANAAEAAALGGLNNHLLDNDLVAVAQTITYDHAFGIVARKDIKTVEDLKGHKIGITAGTASESLWLGVLKKYNLNPADFKNSLVNVEAPEMVAAIQRGDIDAFSSWEPWISRTVINIPETHVLIDNYDVLRDLGFIYMNRKWIESNHDAAIAFMRGMVETDNFIHTKPAETKKLVGDLLNLSPSLVDAIMPKVSYSMKLDADTVVLNNAIVDQLRAKGRIKGEFDNTSWYYPELLRAVAPDRVSLPQ
jgi:ABC-type nitrate/sulfonate/bicarbonate transport system substrate-binding protein